MSERSYEKYKSWCDRYFYLKHRNETRGVGGIFFDDLRDFEAPACLSFIKEVSTAYQKAYLEIVERRKQTPFESSHRDFQAYRRGRYAEFNLVYDRGTLFGLQSGGRTESILMSMPPVAHWIYDYQPKADSAEAQLTDYLIPRDWLRLNQ